MYVFAQGGVVALISQSSLEHAACCDATDERSPFTDQVPSKPRKRKKLISIRAAHQKPDYPRLESLINEAISLKSIDDSFVKLTRNGESNTL